MMKPLFMFLLLVLALASGSSMAKVEVRKLNITWCLHDCTVAGEYDTQNNALTAFNAVVDQIFADRVAQLVATNATCTYTYKNNRYDPMPIGGQYVYNSQSERWKTTNNVVTSYYTKCFENAAYTTSRSDDSIAMTLTMRRHCPREGGWQEGADSHTTVLVDNVASDSWHLYCYKEIPDPPSCVAGDSPPKPVYGNPVSPIDATKNEVERDYASADGRLLVQRSYSSAGGGRWAWGDIGAGLVDFTWRTAGNRDAVSPMSGTFSAIPQGIYLSSAVPPTADRTASFPLLKTQPDTGQSEVAILSANGARVVYVESPLGVFRTKSPGSKSLEVSTTGGVQWFLRSNEEFSLFDGTGTLTQRVRRDGDSLNYTQVGNVLTVTSNVSGRKISYSKDPVSGTILSVTLPDGTTLGYALGANSEDAVTYPDGSIKTYLYNEAAYTGAAVPAPKLLTGIVDENLSRLSTFKYDGVDAVSTERSGGVEKFSIAPAASSVVVSMPVGSASTLYWELGPDGERRMIRNSQPGGSGCAGASSYLAYDVNGNLASQDDFTGSRVCFLNDLTRNVETTRVEGLSTSATCSVVTAANAVLPSGSRKVSTAWHPDWRLEIQVAEPGRITTSVYNGQSDPFNANALASCAPSTALLPDGKPIAVLCKRVEQATTDADGHLGFTAALQSGVGNRVQSWTYNAYGQVLTATDALNHTTSYAYYADTSFTGTDPNAVGHTQGDLQTVTNAAGQVTTYTQYDKHGQLLQSSDPNGVVTANTYDLRQRLLSTSIGGQTTNYSYDPAGQLLQVTAPDASWIGYEYDPAHRLTATKDNLGNRIEYTLDNAGNRVAQNVKDPGGNLARTLARSIDALGRVQQIMGRE